MGGGSGQPRGLSRVTRRRIPLALGAALVGCCLLAGSPSASAAKKKTTAKKKKKRPAAPPVSAAARAAAQSKVEEYLAGSAETPFQQTGALGPFFEQLVRLATTEDRTPVYIIQFGDSHTAADEWTGGLREQFRERFGDGGSGFSLAGHPGVGERRRDARGGGTTGGVSAGVRTGAGDGGFGVGGGAI